MPFDLKNIRIGTRSSALAITQAVWVKEQIEARLAGSRVSLVKITTKGDKILHVPLALVGGKGLFVKEIEEALLRGEIDLAVHSMKDVPTDLPPALHIGITTKREDPRDVLIAHHKTTLADLPLNSRIGTSSLRRRAQLLAYRPDFEIVSLRGNLDTRIRKLKTEALQAIIVAAAGISRMALKSVVSQYLPVDLMLPAIGQGALGIELRCQDIDLLDALSFLNHTETAIAVQAERAYLKRLEGGCQVPIGAFAQLQVGQLVLRGIVADPSGTRVFKKELAGSANDPEGLGTALAEEILNMGGHQVLEEVYGRTLH